MATIPSEQIKTKEILDWKGLHLLILEHLLVHKSFEFTLT